MNSGYLGKLANAKAIKASPHNAIFSFVSLMFDIALINAPMLISKLFRMIKFTKVQMFQGFFLDQSGEIDIGLAISSVIVIKTK